MNNQRRDQVIDPEVLSTLIVRSDIAGLWKLFQHLTVLCILALIASISPTPLNWLVGIGYSFLLIFTFCPLHESIHGSVFKTSLINQAVGNIFGFVLLLPPRFFNAFHMAHHRHTQIPGKDPELLSPKPETLGQYIWHISGIRYWLSQLRNLFRYSSGQVDDFVPASRHKSLINEARLFLLGYLLIIVWSVSNQSLLFWWYWLIPILVGQPFLRLFLLAEHSGCPEVPSMFTNTRTTLTNPLMQWVCWNMNFHTAHHAYAGVPFFRLQATSKLIESHLGCVDDGYITVNRQIVEKLSGGGSGTQS